MLVLILFKETNRDDKGLFSNCSINVRVLNDRFLAFSPASGGFRELREAGRNHFYLSWYLSDAVVTSYDLLDASIYITAYLCMQHLRTDYVYNVCDTKYPRRFFGHNLLPQRRRGTRIGGHGSYKPPGAP